MTTLSVLPYRCPKCFHTNRFPDITTLRAHLELDHSHVPMPSIGMVTMSPRLTSSSLFALGDIDEKKYGFQESARELEKQLFLAAGWQPIGESSWTDTIGPSPQAVLDMMLSKASMPKQQSSDNFFPRSVTTSQQPTSQVHSSTPDGYIRDLSRQVDNHSQQIASLKTKLSEQNQDIKHKEKQLAELSGFIESIDAQQLSHREPVQLHIEDLADTLEQEEMKELNSRRYPMKETPRTDSFRLKGTPRTYRSESYRIKETPRTYRHESPEIMTTPRIHTPVSPTDRDLPDLRYPNHTPRSLSETKLSRIDIQDIDDQIQQDHHHQQLGTLQQQLDHLQQQQDELQQFLVQLSQQESLSKSNRSVSKSLNLETQHSKHDLSKSLPDIFLMKNVAESKLNPNSRISDREKYPHHSVSQSPVHHDSPILQKEHHNHLHFDFEQNRHMNHLNSPTSPEPYQSPPESPSQIEEKHPTMHQHYTLPRQPTTLLPGSHGDRFSKSMSSTLPLYMGSELPKFDVVDEVPEELFYKTDISLEHASNDQFGHEEGNLTYNLPKYSDQRRGSVSPHEPKFSVDYDGMDSLNLRLLEEVFQEIIERKYKKEQDIGDVITNQNLHDNSNRKENQHVQRNSNSNIGASQLENRPVQINSNMNAGAAQHSAQLNRYSSLPNAIPKSSLSPGPFNTGVTYVHDDVDRRPSSVASGRHSQSYINDDVDGRPHSVASGRRSQSYTNVSEVSEMDSFTNVTYTPSVSSYSLFGGYTGPQDPPPKVPLTAHQRYALLCILSHLDIQSLLNCALVCQDWKKLSRHPSLWKNVKLADRRISSQFLENLSTWCSEIEWLTLDNLKPRKKHQHETKEDYQSDIRGCLETGLEHLLHQSGSHLISLTIRNCHSILTERSLWLASCYCLNLCSVTYVSQTDPAGHEVIWSLGAGCRMIESLKIPPGFPSYQPDKFNNRCAQMIGRCWPLLKALSIGGKGVDGKGLVSIAKTLPKLQVLELDHMSKVTEGVSRAMTQNGLQALGILIFRHTPVTTKAILQFTGTCPQLRSLSIHLSPADYFHDDSDADQNAARFHQLHTKLKELSKQPALKHIMHLHIHTTNSRH